MNAEMHTGMTAADYRARAAGLLTARHRDDLPAKYIEQAAVWAQLAQAAAISETKQED
ncbi:hypothetical protein RM572_17730 [Streptomyces sp. DSM 42041]|uniref:Uncharacterized protein n=1 Tax=Streptomyces hazeniae TaxID=3075538 RepID=A0ABU2NX84_9ACTN|nr:hypothetical protein [Streptomyces sp. DSM 42041]MDT0380597.1 hypothetical protein [Streptomyces sp. DSM 42041]